MSICFSVVKKPFILTKQSLLYFWYIFVIFSAYFLCIFGIFYGVFFGYFWGCCWGIFGYFWVVYLMYFGWVSWWAFLGVLFVVVVHLGVFLLFLILQNFVDIFLVFFVLFCTFKDQIKKTAWTSFYLLVLFWNCLHCLVLFGTLWNFLYFVLFGNLG